MDFSEFSFPSSPEGLYDPLRYMISIGGKRIRPRLCMLAYGLYHEGDAPQSVIAGAESLEVFHSFTLIHDDIMDRSPLRRHQPTVWKKWNEVTAILSGDVMLIEAYKRIAKVPNMAACLDLFSKTAAEVCEGQQFDMDFEALESVPMEDYEKMIGLKTAVLLACSAKLGALMAGAPEQECEALYRYGYELGMAFQVADDYLDAYGDEKVFGKPIGGDIVNAKKCWLTTRAQQKASADVAVRLRDALAMPVDTKEQCSAKIDAVRGIYGELGVKEDAASEIRRYSDMALSALEPLHLSEQKYNVFRDFAESLVGRAK